MQSPDQVALSSKVHSGTPSGKYQTPYQNPSSDLTTHQGSCKWDHLEHVHTRADLLLEDLQVQKDSGFDSRYTIRKCNWWIQYSPSGMNPELIIYETH